MSTAVHATAADLDAVANTLTAAFADDPVQQWLFQPAEQPDAARRRFFRFFVDEYFALGHLYVVAGTAGAALWSPPDRDILQGDRVADLLALVAPDLGDETVPRLTELAQAAEFRPPEPHFYLGILGVGPSVQGHGLGRVLVEPVLDACDRGGFPAHLESSNPGNVSFYQRLGFAATGRYRCGDEGPELVAMTRQPAAGASS